MGEQRYIRPPISAVAFMIGNGLGSVVLFAGAFRADFPFSLIFGIGGLCGAWVFIYGARLLLINGRRPRD